VARQLLRLLGTRYGIALLLTIVVIAVVAVMRSVSGPVDESVPGPPIAVSPSTTGPSLGDDSVATEESPPVPFTTPGAPQPETVALDFARAWVNHTGVSADQWRQALSRHATPQLMDRFRETDPAGVPADRIAGAVKLNARDNALIEATIPLDAGTLRLRLIGSGGRWLVDGVDWERP
jgi:hypothetical protein